MLTTTESVAWVKARACGCGFREIAHHPFEMRDALIEVAQPLFESEHGHWLDPLMEEPMAFTGEQTVAELAALRTAVKMLLEAENLHSAQPGEFAKNALKRGIAELTDTTRWGVPEGEKAKFRETAESSYRELFSGL